MRNDTLKLYQSNGSPNSRRVRIFLAEKNLSVEIVGVDLGAKEQFSDAYRAINSRSVIPTLVLANGISIGEVPAICRYLEEIHPDNPLMGSSPEAKALIAMWDRRAELEGFAPVMEGVRNAVPGLKGRAIAGPHGYEQIPEIVERSKLRVANFHADFNRRLSESAFVAGPTFSIADITTLVSVDFATKALGMPVPADHAALNKWYESVATRPSATA
jgi:glutathione S-transferase